MDWHVNTDMLSSATNKNIILNFIVGFMFVRAEHILNVLDIQFFLQKKSTQIEITN